MDQDTKECWLTIGVWGNEQPRCPQLDTVIHCRNCPVFSSAGRDLLNRNIPSEYIQEWTDQLSKTVEEDTKDNFRSAIIFRLGDEWFALSTELIDEVSEMKSVHRLPNTRNGVVKGVVSLRGEIKIWFSIGGLLGIKKYEDWSIEKGQPLRIERLIIMSKDNEEFVFPVSEIIGTRKIPSGELKGVPSTISKNISSYLIGMYDMDGKHVGYINDEHLIKGLKRSLE